MFCRKCGTQNNDNAYKCIKCGEVLQGGSSAPSGQAVPSHLVWSILVTLLCCLPFGIVAIVYSAQVNPKLASGDIAGATESSKKAKMWNWIGFGSGLAFMVLYVLLMILGVIAGDAGY